MIYVEHEKENIVELKDYQIFIYLFWHKISSLYENITQKRDIIILLIYVGIKNKNILEKGATQFLLIYFRYENEYWVRKESYVVFVHLC